MLMIANDFRKILSEYESWKQNDFKDSEFSISCAHKITEKVSKIIDDGNFNVKMLFGQYGWTDYPTVMITHARFQSAQESLAIEYRFDAKNSSVTLALIPRLKNFHDYVMIKSDLTQFLDDYDTASFEVSQKSNAILSKDYTAGELDDEIIRNDLKVLVEVYTGLTGYFLGCLDEIEGIVYENRAFYCRGKPPSTDEACYDIPLKRQVKIRIADISPTYERKCTYSANIKRKEDLFTDRIIERIAGFDITYDDYQDILSKIRSEGNERFFRLIRENNINPDGLKTKDKVLLYSKSFVKTRYKSVGKRLGSYGFDEIRVDDRLSNPLIIISIIHELSHFILERILKEVLMKILETNDTPLISSFIKILLEDNDLNYLLDEFCAHTVEGRFALYGFQDYSSFRYKFDEISDLYSIDDINYALLIVNTFAFDIKDIIEEFIDDELREDIKEEFINLNEEPDHSQLDLEIESRLDETQFLDAISIILLSGISECLSQPDKLDRYMRKYEIS